jgi:chromosome segregation ATPase
MKTFFTLVLILLVPLFAFGQRKSKVDPKDAQIDSLTRYSQSLTRQLDSVSGVLSRYAWAYTALLDSIKTSKDSAIVQLKPACDSIPLLKSQIDVLRANLDSLKSNADNERISLTKEEIDRAKAIDSLKQLRELLESKVLTEAEFIAAKKKYLDKL